jgi:hypothetical protein
MLQVAFPFHYCSPAKMGNIAEQETYLHRQSFNVNCMLTIY